MSDLGLYLVVGISCFECAHDLDDAVEVLGTTTAGEIENLITTWLHNPREDPRWETIPEGYRSASREGGYWAFRLGGA